MAGLGGARAGRPAATHFESRAFETGVAPDPRGSGERPRRCRRAADNLDKDLKRLALAWARRTGNGILAWPLESEDTMGQRLIDRLRRTIKR